MDIFTIFGGLVTKIAERIVGLVFDRFASSGKLVDHNSQAHKIATRLRQTLDLMNEGRKQDKIQIAKLADIMGMEKAGQLEDFFSGTNEPTFDFVERFADCFGVNKVWLKFGEGKPYACDEQNESDPMEYYDAIIKLNPEEIIFLKDDSEYGHSLILVKMSDFKFVIFPGIYYISSHVGGTGSCQIYSYYKLIMKLRENWDYYSRCVGYLVDEKTFFKMADGEVFIGTTLHTHGRHSHWWDDFTDIDHEYAVAEEYPELYGKEFLSAQKIVKWRIDRDNKRGITVDKPE